MYKKEEAVQVWSGGGGGGGKHARVLQPAPSAALDSTNNYNNPAPVLFRASFCFKVFTVIVALPGVDDSLSPY